MIKKLPVLLALAFPVALAAAPVEIAPHIRLIAGEFVPGVQPDGNTLVWQGKDGLVVFDTGRHPKHTQEILDLAESDRLPIVAIINSHWHLDHVGGNIMLRGQFPDARVFASPALENALTRFLANYGTQLQQAVDDPDTSASDKAAYRAELGLLANPDALRPTDVVSRSDTVTVAGIPLELHVEAHAVTSADIWVLDSSSGVLASGDLVTLPAPLMDTACPDQWRLSLDHLADVDFKLLVPGHGEPMNKARFLDYRTAFDNLLDCAAAEKGTETCIGGWLGDTRDFSPSTDTQQTRDLLTFYLEHNLKPGNTQRYCSE